MVDRCSNPHCRMEFKALSSGDLYAYERRSAETEFFWLCSVCAPRYDLYLDRSGCVSVRARCAVHHEVPPHPDGNLRLVTRSTRSMSRLQTIPSSERASSSAVGAGPFPSEFCFRGGTHR
jgi:hypothetical protein